MITSDVTSPGALDLARRDAESPGAVKRRLAEPAQLPCDAQKSLLQHVLRGGVVAQETPDVSVQRPL